MSEEDLDVEKLDNILNSLSHEEKKKLFPELDFKTIVGEFTLSESIYLKTKISEMYNENAKLFSASHIVTACDKNFLGVNKNRFFDRCIDVSWEIMRIIRVERPEYIDYLRENNVTFYWKYETFDDPDYLSKL